MPEDLKGYRVFIATPGGLDEVRQAFRKTLVDHNESDALHRGVTFIPVGWEITLGGIGRAQALINEDLEKCDYFVLVLHNRWGTPPGVGEDNKYTSGTEEEFNVAMQCFKDDNMPMRQLVVFFRGVDPQQLADPGAQLTKVLDFKKDLEQKKTPLYHTFDAVGEFEKCLRDYLHQWVREHEDAKPAKVTEPEPPPKPTVPALAEPEPPTGPDQPESKDIEHARKLADEGRLTEAEAHFARLIVKGDNPESLNAYGLFLNRVGRLEQAQVMFEQVLDVAKRREHPQWQANAYGNLGLIYQMRGDLDRGEAMHRKSLEIEEKLGRLEGMASQYGNLGLIYQTRGDLDQAEAMLRKSLEINEKLGRLEGMAIQYGNLGSVYEQRGDPAKARDLWTKARDLFAQIGMPHMVEKVEGWLARLEGDQDGA